MKIMGNKKGQEEMIGFALILVLVAVILLVFLGLALSNPSRKTVQNYEINSFLQSSLQYTTDCENNLNYQSINELIFMCIDEDLCIDGKKSCDVLNETYSKILDSSWKVGDDTPIKGYKLNIFSSNKDIFVMEKGIGTKNSEGGMVTGRAGMNVSFEIYY